MQDETVPAAEVEEATPEPVPIVMDQGGGQIEDEAGPVPEVEGAAPQPAPIVVDQGGGQMEDEAGPAAEASNYQQLSILPSPSAANIREMQLGQGGIPLQFLRDEDSAAAYVLILYDDYIYVTSKYLLLKKFVI